MYLWFSISKRRLSTLPCCLGNGTNFTAPSSWFGHHIYIYIYIHTCPSSQPLCTCFHHCWSVFGILKIFRLKTHFVICQKQQKPPLDKQLKPSKYFFTDTNHSKKYSLPFSLCTSSFFHCKHTKKRKENQFATCTCTQSQPNTDWIRPN